MTKEDLAVLGPLAEHPVLLLPQLALLLGVTEGTAANRMRRLRDAELVVYDHPLKGGPGVAAIRPAGLRAIGVDPRGRGVRGEPGSARSRKEIDLYSNRHEIGLAWLWMAARAGAFGALDSIHTERALVGADRSAPDERSPGERAHGLGLGQLNGYGSQKRHYPDLLLTMRSGHRVAIELELSGKRTLDLASIMRAYASDGRIDRVLYLVEDAVIGRRVSDAAARAGISDLVRVERLAESPIVGVDGLRATARGGSAPERDRSGARGAPGERGRVARARPAPTRQGAER